MNRTIVIRDPIGPFKRNKTRNKVLHRDDVPCYRQCLIRESLQKIYSYTYLLDYPRPRLTILTHLNLKGTRLKIRFGLRKVVLVKFFVRFISDLIMKYDDREV